MELRSSRGSVEDPRHRGEKLRSRFPANPEVIECELNFPPLRRREGALFLAGGNEPTWSIYLLEESLLFLRAPGGALVMRAPVDRGPTAMRLHRIEIDGRQLQSMRLSTEQVPSLVWGLLDRLVYLGIGTHAAPLIDGFGGIAGLNFLGSHGSEVPRILFQPREPVPRMHPGEEGAAELKLATRCSLREVQQLLQPSGVAMRRTLCVPWGASAKEGPGWNARPALSLRTREDVTFSIFRRGPFPELATGDILSAPARCLVTTANPGFHLTGGIGAHLLRALGSKYVEVLRQAVKETFGGRSAGRGDMVVTSGEGTQFESIVHVAAVGPRYEVDETSLEETTRRTLKTVDDLGLESVALPAFATGYGRVPFEVAARAMRRGLVAALPDLRSLEEIQIWVLSNPEMYEFVRGWMSVDR